MSNQKNYLKYKKKYLNLKKTLFIGGTQEIPGNPHDITLNIRTQYNEVAVYNNIDEEEYKIISPLNGIDYFNNLYFNNTFGPDEKKIQILNNFNLFYKKLYLKGVGIENYPYGVYQLKNFISLTNEFTFLYNKNIIYNNSSKLEFHNLYNDTKKFIEVIRFEKDIEDNFVFQDKISEKINDPGYMLKGIYYYPCLGSGIFLNIKNIKYYYNKLHAISELHDELSKKTQQVVVPPLQPHGVVPLPQLVRNPSSHTYTEPKFKKRQKEENLFEKIKKEEIITELINKFKLGRFDTSKSIVISNFEFICGSAKRFNYLNEISLLKFFFEIFCDKDINKKVDFEKCEKTIKKKIYEIYYKIFSGELKFSDLKDLADLKKDTEFSKSIIYLHSLTDTNVIDISKRISDLFKDKDIISNFINKNSNLYNHIKKFKVDNNYLDSKDNILIINIINNIMIEMYSQIYCANFNQLIIDATLYYYARKLDVDTVVVLLEPTDREEIFGSEIISIEDFQLDSFNRTINYRKIKLDKLDEFNISLNNYLYLFNS
jgi:hypothetical protein